MKAHDTRLEGNRAAQCTDAWHPASRIGAGQANSGADGVQAGLRDPQGTGRIRGVLQAQRNALGFELLAYGPKSRQLLSSKEWIRVVGGGEVGVKAIELEAGELLDPADNGYRLLRRCA